MQNYNCPECGWKPPIDKMYEVVNGKIKKLKAEDFEKFLETENPYPKIIDMKTELIDGLFEGTKWTEVHYCPKCNKEFSFENANY